jgi:DNA modification methylase
MNTTLDAALYGTDLFGESMRPPVTSPVAQKFLVSPFSVLNAREGDWQERKRAWAAMGIKGECGRDATTYNTGGPGTLAKQYSSAEGRAESLAYVKGSDAPDYWKEKMGKAFTDTDTGTSIFDPVLCELAYRWWSGEGAQILDPFAGGSVRGIVAAHLGRKYWGCDLRAEQIEANRAQGAALCEGKPMPEWVCGDSMNEVEKAPEADFIFSCPPYGDLEQYSDLREDLSAMPHKDFVIAYRTIILRACKRLRNDRFACFVVGDFRDGKGNYRNFVSETIAAFLDAGLALYNEAILVTSVGSASMRVTRQFSAGRKLCKTHQNVLVFVKGDGRKAADICGLTT